MATDDPTLASLRDSLRHLRDEQAALEQRGRLVAEAVRSLQATIEALEGTGARPVGRPDAQPAVARVPDVPVPPAPSPTAGETPAATASTRARARSARKAPRITADDLVAAVQRAGGTATTAQLVDALGVNDGRSLNGARRTAVDEGRLVVDDGTYQLVAADAAVPATADDARDADTGLATDPDDANPDGAGPDAPDPDDPGPDEQDPDEQNPDEQGPDEQDPDRPGLDSASMEQSALSDDDWEASGRDDRTPDGADDDAREGELLGRRFA